MSVLSRELKITPSFGTVDHDLLPPFQTDSMAQFDFPIYSFQHPVSTLRISLLSRIAQRSASRSGSLTRTPLRSSSKRLRSMHGLVNDGHRSRLACKAPLCPCQKPTRVWRVSITISNSRSCIAFSKIEDTSLSWKQFLNAVSIFSKP